MRDKAPAHGILEREDYTDVGEVDADDVGNVVVDEAHARRVSIVLETERAKRDAKRLLDLESAPDATAALEFQSFADLAREVDAAGPPRWLLRGLWPSGDYGVHAAEPKAQKTWTACDMGVSVASDTPWLGYIQVDDPGPVLSFVGEGGKRNFVRRIRAIAESRGINADALPIVVCARAPHLGSLTHLQMIAAQIQVLRPKLVIVDPLYLSAKGANLADLYAMGAMLEAIQRICQQFGASLLIVTHFNRKDVKGPARITGAGPAEWGRVLLSAGVKSRRTDPVTKATDVITELDIVGGEIADQTLRVYRRIWADDPDDLSSPLHITTIVTEGEQDAPVGQEQPGLTPAAHKLLEALRHVHPATNAQLVDWVATKHGHGLRRETVSRTMSELERAGLASRLATGSARPGTATLWDLPAERDSALCDRDRVTAP